MNRRDILKYTIKYNSVGEMDEIVSFVVKKIFPDLNIHIFDTWKKSSLLIQFPYIYFYEPNYFPYIYFYETNYYIGLSFCKKDYSERNNLDRVSSHDFFLLFSSFKLSQWQKVNWKI